MNAAGPEAGNGHPGLRRGWLWTIAFYYLCVIGVLSSLPGAVITDLGFDIWDKAAHFGIYLPIGASLWLALRHSPQVSRPLALMGLALLTGAALGGLDELHQSFVPGRFCTISDVVADALGVLAGSLVARGGASLWAISRSRSRTTG